MAQPTPNTPSQYPPQGGPVTPAEFARQQDAMKKEQNENYMPMKHAHQLMVSAQGIRENTTQAEVDQQSVQASNNVGRDTTIRWFPTNNPTPQRNQGCHIAQQEYL